MVDHKAAPWWNDDDALLAALERALHPDADVPDSITRTALACYSWHQIDAELAALAYDSASDDSELTRTRTESAILRALTFEASDLTIELEVRPDGLAGQLIAAPGSELDLQLSNGQTITISLNKHGYFKISPSPTMPFRLRCRLPDNRIVPTVLIAL
jgi:hypothetical protein